MHIEQETVDFVATIIAEKYPKFGTRNLERIARHAILEDKVADPEWLDEKVSTIRYAKYKYRRSVRARQIAEEQQANRKRKVKFHPIFRLFTTKQAEKFKRLYGKKSLKFLQKRLDDPTFVSPQWASHFMATILMIGKESLLNRRDLYHFVTTHEYWEQCREQAREVFSNKKIVH